MSEVIPVTVVMRSFNDAALLPRTFEALDAQTGVDVSLSVFESASTDNSLELIEAHGYDRIEKLESGSYNSSRVLNCGVEHAETEAVAFLNSDAIMDAPETLRTLADVLLSDPKCAGVFARQLPRPDADAMTRLEYVTAFDRRSELGESASDLSLVCSMIRKSAWEELTFDTRLTFAEDAVWSRGIRERGWRTHYVPEAAAEHSHNYTSAQRYRRAFGDRAALAVLDSQPQSGSLFLPWARRCLRDALRCCAMGKPHWAFQVLGHHWPLVRGARDGARAGYAHFNGSESDEIQPTV